MEREQSLEKLQTKVAQYDAAITQVQETSTNLGGGNGPIRLNYTLDLSELDLSTRITKVVGIRRQIIIRTIPRLETDRKAVVSQIETHTESRLRANIEFVRSYLGQGATEKELELAEQALQTYRARTTGTLQAVPTPPVETPAPREVKPRETTKEAILMKMGYLDNFIIPEGKDPDSLDLKELGLTVRVYNALYRRFVPYNQPRTMNVAEILSLTADEFSNIRNMGEKNQNDFLEALIRFGVKVKPEGPEMPPASPADEISDEEKQRKQAEFVQRGKESRIKFAKTLPDGQTIEILGKLQAETFDLIFSASKENPVTAEKIEADQRIARLRKTLEQHGWTIIQPVPPQDRAKGERAFYYPQKIETGRSSRVGAREKQTINMPDNTTLEVYGKRGKGIQFIVSNNQFSVLDFAKEIYGSDNQSSINKAKSLIYDLKQYLAGLGWETDFPKDLKDAKEVKTFSIKKGQPELILSPEAVEQINKLQAEITELKVSLEETSSEPVLFERIKTGIEEKKEQLRALTGAKVDQEA